MEHAQEKFASVIQIYARLAKDEQEMVLSKYLLDICILNINFILSRCAWILLLLPSQGHLL